MQCADGKRIGCVPHDVLDRLPFPVQEIENQAGQEHVRAALDRRRDDFRPGALESLACHHAVLNRKQTQQNAIDNQRRYWRPGHAGVDRFGNTDVGDKPDCVEERDEEDHVRNQAVGESQET